jgi:hypothetical protein
MLGPNRLPEIARACLLALGAQLRTLKVASEYLPENFLATSHGLFGLAALVGTGKALQQTLAVARSIALAPF